MNELSKEMVSHFENLKHIDEKGVEYWSARELYPLLGYTQWRNFELIIEKAKISCEKASGSSLYDFADVSKIVRVGPTEKSVKDYFLTRYACYLIAQNGDSRKAEIAQAQTYFAIQTRYAEIKQMEEYKSLTTEEEMRLFLRQQLRRHNSELADTAHNAGVMTSLDYAIFQNFGYKGLYNGLDAKAIARRKGI